MSLKDEIQADLAEIENDLGPQTFTYPAKGGKEYLCSTGNLRDGATLEIGGWSAECDAVLYVRKAVFGDDALPTKKKMVSYKGRTLRIDHISADPTGAMIVLGLVSPNKGV